MRILNQLWNSIIKEIKRTLIEAECMKRDSCHVIIEASKTFNIRDYRL